MVALPPNDRDDRLYGLPSGRARENVRKRGQTPLAPFPQLPFTDLSLAKTTPSTTALLAGRINTDHELPNCVAIGLPGPKKKINNEPSKVRKSHNN